MSYDVAKNESPEKAKYNSSTGDKIGDFITGFFISSILFIILAYNMGNTMKIFGEFINNSYLSLGIFLILILVCVKSLKEKRKFIIFGLLIPVILFISGLVFLVSLFS